MKQDLNGKKFSELEDEDKNKIRKRAIRAIVILNESDPEIRFEVFERLNTGMVELSAQDVRHAIYTGNFNDLLIELGKKVLKVFKFSTKKDEKVKSAEELVLRFFAFYAQAEQNEEDFGTDDNNIKPYLNRFMKENKELEEKDIIIYRKIFISTITKVKKYLNNVAFKMPKDDGKAWEQKNNRNIFNFLMLAFALEKNIKLSPEEFLLEYENYFRQHNSELKKGLGFTNKTNLQNKVNIIRQILRGKI